MGTPSFMRQGLRSPLSALSLLFFAAVAQGTDTYVLSTRQLTIPSMSIGSSQYSNVVVTVANIVTAPSGNSPNGSSDSFDPQNNQLSVRSVNVGATIFYNAVVTVSSLISIGAVTGADSFDGATLHISQVQFNGTDYQGVAVAEGLGNIVRIAGGMPTAVPDTYNSNTNELAIPAVQVGSRVYTNVIVTVGTLLGVSGIHSSVAESVLDSFNYVVGSNPDGSNPQASLVQGRDSIFYGTTPAGGLHNGGTVFKFTGGTETVLYSFCSVNNPTCTDGNQPVSALIQGHGSDDNFYGTTQIGGVGQGTVFSMTPAGVEAVLHMFCGTSGATNCPPNDGASPQGGLVEDSEGNFYGTTFIGGTHNQGTVFMVTPAGVETVLHSFTGNGGVSGSTDGAHPQGSLILASDGNFYGTTYQGGTDDLGTVFQITPAGVLTVLHSFAESIGGAMDGGLPQAGVVQGIDGNFYGTTASGGSTNGGTVFRVTAAGTASVLYSFSQAQNSTDGYDPVAGLFLASDGNFYGTTLHGGLYVTGAAFKVTPDGVETVLHSFGNSSDASFPKAGLIQASDGNLYGTTYSGGTDFNGAIFELAHAVGQ